MLRSGNVIYHHAKRYKQIVDVLIRYGFGYLIDRIGISIPKGIATEGLKRRPETSSPAKRVALMLEELGPTFVKFGQMLSTRPDILPEAYLVELRKLQDDVEGINFDEIRRLLKSELGGELESIFLSFDQKPLAAASLSQVHKASLPDGQWVAIKVQRPHIEETIRTDLEILMGIMRLVERRIPESRVYEPVARLRELGDAMLLELDFTQEAWHMEKFRRNFEGDTMVYVPRVFDDLTTKRVITMEYIDARKMKEIPRVPRECRRKLAEKVTTAMMKQVFVHGFFHGDPHPGNILVRDDGKIVFIDFGLMGRVDGFIKDKLARLIVGAISNKPDFVSNAILAMNHGNQEFNEESFSMDIEDLLERYYEKTLKQIEISALLDEIFLLIARYKLMLPPNFTLLLKSIITVEGVGRELDEDLNVFDVAKPFAQKLLLDYYSPRQFFQGFFKKASDLSRAFTLIPDIVEGIYNRVKADKVKIEFESSGLEKVICELNSMMNRLVLGLIISAIIIGSSVVILAQRGPVALGLPIIGLVGFTTAGFLGIGIIVSILKSGRV